MFHGQKRVWFNVPRRASIKWLSFLGRLPTKDRMQSWRMGVDAGCCLCLREAETHEHLFFLNSEPSSTSRRAA